MEKAPRQSNIELLRIVLMLMIITHHVIVHGLGLYKINRPAYTIDTSTYFELLINSFVVIGVNTFVFISGYFGMKFKFKTVISFILQALFYSVGLYFISRHVNHIRWDIDKFLLALQPISTKYWWFLTTYLALYFISPVLNKGFEAIERNQKAILLAGLLFFDCYAGFKYGTLSGNGYTLFHFITLYLLARFISRYIPTIRKALLLEILITMILYLVVLRLLFLNQLKDVWTQFYYNNPLLIISSVLLFFVFKNLKIQSRFINVISGSVFGVYLFHEHYFIKQIMIKNIAMFERSYSTPLFIGIVILIIIGIFIAGTVIELGRKQLFDPLIVKLVSLWENNPGILRVKLLFKKIIHRMGGIIELQEK